MAKPHKLKDGRYECQNCLGKFTKNPSCYIDPLFCSDPCRKEFHTTGGISLKRLDAKIRRVVREELKAIADETRAILLEAIPITSAHPKVPNGRLISSQAKSPRSWPMKREARP